jgi:hypothetical protein
MDSSVVSWVTTPPQSAQSYVYMFDLGGASSITFRDVTLSLDLNCYPSCRNGGNGAVANILNIGPGAESVRVDRVRLRTTMKGENLPDFPSGVDVDSWGYTRPESVYVSSSIFETSGTGVRFYGCDDCWVSDSTFRDAPSATPIDNRRSYAYVVKQLGEGVRIVSNTFDMLPHYANEVRPFEGVLLWNAGTGPGEGSQVIGNTFKNIQTGTQFRTIILYGYNDANISGNQFTCGVSVCDTWAIETELNCQFSCNRRNIIANNVFDKFSVHDSTSCPILLQRVGDGLANESQANLVMGNIFRTDATTSGVCGGQSGGDNLTSNNVNVVN